MHETLESFKELLTPDTDHNFFDVLYLFEIITVHVFFSLECGVSGPEWRAHPARKYVLTNITLVCFIQSFLIKIFLNILDRSLMYRFTEI